MTDKETIQHLWDIIDKIHTAADDARRGQSGSNPSHIVMYIEKLARGTMATVERPVIEVSEISDS